MVQPKIQYGIGVAWAHLQRALDEKQADRTRVHTEGSDSVTAARDRAVAETTYQIAAAELQATQLDSIAASSTATDQQQFDSIAANAKVDWLTALAPAYVTRATALANYHLLFQAYYLLSYDGTDPLADYTFAFQTAQAEANREDANAYAETYAAAQQFESGSRAASHVVDQALLDVGKAAHDKEYAVNAATVDKAYAVALAGTGASPSFGLGTSGPDLAAQQQADITALGLTRTTEAEDDKLQFELNENGYRAQYSLNLAAAAKKQDNALAPIEANTDQAEAGYQFALDAAYAQAEISQWSQESIFDGDTLADALADVAWQTAQETANVAAAQAIDSALTATVDNQPHHLPWAQFLVAQTQAHQQWWGTPTPSSGSLPQYPANSGAAQYLSWISSRIVDEATWRQNVAFTQGQELLTQRTARLSETTSDAAALKTEQDTIAQAKYNYIADPTGVAPAAKLYLDNLALYEHNHTIALAQLAAIEATTPDFDPTDQAATIEAEYLVLKATNQANYEAAAASAISSEQASTAGAQDAAASQLDQNQVADDVTYANSSYDFELKDAQHYVGLVAALAGHDKAYLISQATALLAMANALAAPSANTTSPWATYFASAVNAFNTWSAAVAEANRIESIDEADANAGLDADGNATGGGELGEAAEFRDESISDVQSDGDDSSGDGDDEDGDPPAIIVPELEPATTATSGPQQSSQPWEIGLASLGGIAPTQADEIVSAQDPDQLIRHYVGDPEKDGGVTDQTVDQPEPLPVPQMDFTLLNIAHPSYEISRANPIDASDALSAFDEFIAAQADDPSDDQDLAPPPSVSAIHFVSLNLSTSSFDRSVDGIGLPKVGDNVEAPRIEFVVDRVRLDDLPAKIEPFSKQPMEFTFDATGSRSGDNDFAKAMAKDPKKFGPSVMDRVGDGRWHHAKFDPASGKMTVRFVEVGPHKIPHEGAFDDYVKWVAGLGSKEATLRNLPKQRLEAIQNLLKNHRDQLLNKLGKNEKALKQFVKAADNAYAWRTAFERASAGKAVAQQADGAIAKSTKVAMSSGRIKGGVVRKAGRAGAVALESLPVISVVVAGSMAAVAASQEGADLKAILKAAGFNAMNEFTGANDIKFVFEVVIAGSELTYKRFVLDATDPHIKVIQNQFMNDRADKEDQIFNSLVDLMVSKIDATVGRE
jgi:hypothetical protein